MKMDPNSICTIHHRVNRPWNHRTSIYSMEMYLCSRRQHEALTNSFHFFWTLQYNICKKIFMHVHCKMSIRNLWNKRKCPNCLMVPQGVINQAHEFANRLLKSTSFDMAVKVLHLEVSRDLNDQFLYLFIQ